MELNEVLDSQSEVQNFKSNVVQNIFTDSIQEEIQQNNQERLDLLQQSANSNISEVTETLILTSASNVNPPLLESLCVSCVVNVAPELPDTPLENHDVIYHKIDISDSSNSRILPYFDDAADLIHQVSMSGGRALIYCVAGVSRSASICLAYLMKHEQMSLLEAYNFLKARRRRIKPNCGFFKQLIEYEKKLSGTNTVHMIFNEFVQMEIPDVYDSEYRIITNFSRKHRLRH